MNVLFLANMNVFSKPVSLNVSSEPRISSGIGVTVLLDENRCDRAVCVWVGTVEDDELSVVASCCTGGCVCVSLMHCCMQPSYVSKLLSRLPPQPPQVNWMHVLVVWSK